MMKPLIRLCRRRAIGRDKHVSEVEESTAIDVIDLMFQGEVAAQNSFSVLDLC